MANEAAVLKPLAPSGTSEPEPSPRTPPWWGGALTDEDYSVLARAWISRELADEAMIRRVDSTEGREVIGQKGNRDCAGLLFPIYWPGCAHPHSYRLRRDNPEWTQGKGGKSKPNRKYLSGPGAANRLYFPPNVTPEQLLKPTLPVVIVEGEKKALALQRLACHETHHCRVWTNCSSSYAPIAGTASK